ncbi:MAG: PEGA domain-containing protein [Candidatus Margulisbacteria bacterium]|nr:PEGA domain-containing protein [Candidatus Margulisiibacteriota bacterium]
MSKTRFFITVTFFILMSFSYLWAENLNIINENPEAEIYLDGVMVGKEAAYNLNVTPGSHHVRVVLQGNTVFSQIVEVEYGKTKSINTTHFVDIKTDMANKGAKIQEAERIREAKGDLALGFYLGDISSGLSMKWFPFKDIGFQAMGWWASNPDSSLTSLEIRPVFTLVNTIAFNRPMSLYFALGSASRASTYVSPKETGELLEAVLGFEFSGAIVGIPLSSTSSAYHDRDSNIMASAVGAGGLALSFFENAYIDVEIGIERMMINNNLRYEGVKFSTGLFFYF